MALPPQTDQTFIREVDEELRRDELLRIWTRYGRWIIAGVVALLVLLAAFLVWQNYRQSAAGKTGQEFDDAVRNIASNQPDKAAPTLQKLAGDSRDGYRAMARFWQASIALQKNDVKGAVAKFSEVADDNSLPQPFRDLALVRKTAAEYDSIKPDEVISRLGAMAVPDSPWFGSAGEMVAVAYLRLGKRDQAGKLFGQLAQNETVSGSIRQRAVQMASALGVDAVDQTGESKAK